MSTTKDGRTRKYSLAYVPKSQDLSEVIVRIHDPKGALTLTHVAHVRAMSKTWVDGRCSHQRLQLSTFSPMWSNMVENSTTPSVLCFYTFVASLSITPRANIIGTAGMTGCHKTACANSQTTIVSLQQTFAENCLLKTPKTPRNPCPSQLANRDEAKIPN